MDDAGTDVTFGILRNAKPQSFKVRVESFPDVRTPTLEATTTSATALKPETLVVFGMHLSGLTSDLRKTFATRTSVQGVLITEIDAGSSASENAVKPGDVLVEINGKAVGTTADVGVKVKALRDDGKRSALLLVSNGQGEVRFVALAVD